jgi:hypothetical protein
MEAPFFGVLLSHKSNMEGPYLKRYGPSILVWETGPKQYTVLIGLYEHIDL